MCNITGIIFGITNLTHHEAHNKDILEVGSFNVNGSLRAPIIDLCNPAKYIGIDMIPGPGVDIVSKAEDLLKLFNHNSFDIVISTELLEHVINWRTVISNIKNICRPNGIILITTRSYPFPYHGYPCDYWRYELNDMKNIFSDCIIEKLETDPLCPGVFLKARKPKSFIEQDLSYFDLYSTIKGNIVRDINQGDIDLFLKVYNKKQKVKYFVKKLSQTLERIIDKVIFK